MSGNRVLLDTNVIILLSKSKIDAKKLSTRYNEFFVSMITYMEIYGFDFKEEKEKRRIDAFFANVELVNISMEIAETVIRYKGEKMRKIKLPDAIILATASLLGAELLSDDWSDFIGIDKSVMVKDISDLKQ